MLTQFQAYNTHVGTAQHRSIIRNKHKHIRKCFHPRTHSNQKTRPDQKSWATPNYGSASGTSSSDCLLTTGTELSWCTS